MTDGPRPDETDEEYNERCRKQVEAEAAAAEDEGE